jgi:hypothetical protein
MRVPFERSDHLYLVPWLTCVVLLGGCRPAAEPAPAAVIDVAMTPDPPRVGMSSVTLKVADSAGKPITGAQIEWEGIMKHPGMSPVFARTFETGVGQYQSTIDFTMAGDWVLVIRMTLTNGKKLERQIEIRGVRPG